VADVRPTIQTVVGDAAAVIKNLQGLLTGESITANFALQKALEHLGGFERNATLAALCVANQVQNARDKAAKLEPKKASPK
jgi:hypothetical protein